MIELSINGERRAFPRPSSRPSSRAMTVADLIATLGYAGKRIAVERNGEIVPRSQHADTPLADGDQLEIVVAVGGG